MYEKRKNLKKSKIQKQSEETKKIIDRIIRDTWTLYKTKEEKEERKKLEKKKLMIDCLKIE